jgi:hypothetical protein
MQRKLKNKQTNLKIYQTKKMAIYKHAGYPEWKCANTGRLLIKRFATPILISVNDPFVKITDLWLLKRKQ